MTAVALAVVIAGCLSLIAWLTYGRVADARALADERVAHAATTAQLERAGFEIERTKAALTESQRLNDGLEDVLAGYINSAPNSDLARADVLSRLVRAAKKQGTAAGRGGAVPSGTAPSVSQEASTDRAGPPGMPPDRDALLQP